jgi:hypothetical protein
MQLEGTMNKRGKLREDGHDKARFAKAEAKRKRKAARQAKLPKPFNASRALQERA